ncbi:hypothetical protein W822_19985 [Advenella kashmirensis W13003]|uniref:Uncharacterized protein n=1 Tax=Advenella kashmirensis W13003 TaxID=1424334 RepID=V8QPK9_9BURK|nr:hypothetical protein [Advenella kashmirensis]ETF00934.1 hypothetical protein W822_19985 [Advenella kashmirensis W13003]
MANPQIPRGMCPLISAYSGGDIGGVMETPVEGGSPRTALEYDGGVQPFTVTLPLTPEKYHIWTLFYHRIIKKGSKPFDMMIDSGDGAELHTCFMVVKSYSMVRNQQHSFVTFTVNVQPSAYKRSIEDAQAEIDLWNDGLSNYGALFAGLDKYINHDVNVLGVISGP